MPDMQKILETKNKIIQVVQINGPSLPVKVAKEIGQNNLFTAAFMSELVGEQRLRLSNMRVGGSPLYYIAGQEEQLQKFTEYLNHKEKEAFKLLKEKEILDENEQEPAIRVALKSIKDFAVPIKIINNNQEKTFWKIHTLTNDKAKDLIESVLNPKSAVKEEIKQTIEKEPETIKELPKENKEDIKEIKVELPITKEKKSKEIDSAFLDKVRKNLADNGYEIIKEILIKKKEFVSKVRINTKLGNQELYLVAKDKKKITLDDLVNTLQKAQSEKMPALILSQGDIDKKALEYYKEWSNLIRHQKVNF